MPNSSNQIDQSASPVKLKSLRSLVVEDDFSCRVLLDGREALAQIRAIERNHSIAAHGAKILMTTTLHDARTVFSAFGAKCDEYLVKPVDGKKMAEQLWNLGLLVEGARPDGGPCS